MQDDAALFRQFASQNSEEAFAELVRRHVDLVYSAALRRVAGHSGLAQDIAQEVFSDLARKAHSLPPGTVLVAWLHRATQFASAAAVRAETRRIHANKGSRYAIPGTIRLRTRMGLDPSGARRSPR